MVAVVFRFKVSVRVAFESLTDSPLRRCEIAVTHFRLFNVLFFGVNHLSGFLLKIVSVTWPAARQI